MSTETKMIELWGVFFPGYELFIQSSKRSERLGPPSLTLTIAVGHSLLHRMPQSAVTHFLTTARDLNVEICQLPTTCSCVNTENTHMS